MNASPGRSRRLPPLVENQTVAAMIRTLGSHTAFVRVTSHGICRMSPRRSIGRKAWRKAPNTLGRSTPADAVREAGAGSVAVGRRFVQLGSHGSQPGAAARLGTVGLLGAGHGASWVLERVDGTRGGSSEMGGTCRDERPSPTSWTNGPDKREISHR